jgi:hypothetical protein
MALDYIDTSDAEDWLLCSSLDLIARKRVSWEGEPIPTSELTPIITYDANLDRMFNRLASGRHASFTPTSNSGGD